MVDLASGIVVGKRGSPWICCADRIAYCAYPGGADAGGGSRWAVALHCHGTDTGGCLNALREVVAFSASDKDHGDLLESALDLLDKLASINRTWAVEKILDDMTGLGPHAGFWQTSQYARPLMITVRRLGDLLTAEQVVRMVRRGETYCRAGLHGLSQLYDSWPEHAGSLGLPELFKGIGAIEMEWYTLAREHYHDLDGFQLMSAFAAGKLSKRRFGRAALAEDEDLGTRLWSSWPNRGDSALLDNLSLAEVPPA